MLQERRQRCKTGRRRVKYPGIAQIADELGVNRTLLWFYLDGRRQTKEGQRLVKEYYRRAA